MDSDFCLYGFITNRDSGLYGCLLLVGCYSAVHPRFGKLVIPEGSNLCGRGGGAYHTYLYGM